MELENWKAVVGYEGLYEVSDLGRVRRLKILVRGGWGANGRLLKTRLRKPVLDPKGYLRMVLHTLPDAQGVRRQSANFVHRLVALAFIGPFPAGKRDINHKDFNRTNNSVSNLEWVSPAENIEHSARAGRFWAENAPKQSRFTVEQIKAVKELLVAGDKSRAEISEITGVGVSTITSVTTGKSWTLGGVRGVRSIAETPWAQAGRRRKLSPLDVLTIRGLRGTASAAKIGAMFGVSAPTIWGILNGKYWKGAPDVT